MALEKPSTSIYMQVWRENAVSLAGFLIAFVLYLILRLQVNQELPVNDAFYGNYNRIWLALEAMKFYLHQIFYPFLSISARHPLESTVTPWSLADCLGNLATLFVLGMVGYHAIRKKSCSAWMFLAGISCLLLVLHIIPISTHDNIGHERFLTLPLAFFSISIVLMRHDLLLSHLRSMKLLSHILRPLLLTWVIFAYFTTLTSIPIWKNEVTLWKWNLHIHPDAEGARSAYLFALLSAGQVEEGRRFVHEAVPRLDEQITFGSYLVSRRYPEGLIYLKGLIGDISPKSDPETTKLLAKLYSAYSEAIFVFQKDVDEAVHLNGIAIRHDSSQLKGSVSRPVTYRQIAYFYAKGNFEKADKLKKQMDAIVGKGTTARRITKMLNDYCQDAASPHCARIHKEVIPKTGLTPESA
jgi:hypothetical protein